MSKKLEILYLVQWAGEIVWRESVLLKEFFLDDFGDIKSEFLIFRERVLTDELHNFVELDFFMKDFLDGLSQVGEILVELVEIRIKLSLVVGSGDGPVN